ncbi:MAG: Protein of unknown function (DUF1553)/Protein of unknown function (DUF1549)/Planctomycete [Verrucomicrobiales bacterium]|nr:Protein of unknown function (DUF1553)/Protein of unknown function (DUF1549)/Planctomycete [Verrucomicrobiales bacterium]
MRTVSRPFLLASTFCAVAYFGAAISTHSATPSRPGFNKDIRPILSDNCFACHGQDSGSRKAGLRLDVRAEALKGGKSEKPALVPGKPDASELIARITARDKDEMMPPTKTGKVISATQLDKLRQWISQGAEYQPHWAFIPPQRPELPSKGAQHPIDQFVRAKLAQEKLSPSPKADRATLLRRVSLDLTGLPPTPQELDSFIADKSKDAYDKQVERLLASTRFGEKWGRHWLDAARYADSDGYEKDLPRAHWRWRDWVINAINRDLPYDKFIIEQIAGDLLPNSTQDQRIATGFLRNSMVNEEGAIIAEQFRTEAIIDRMDCVGKAVLGVTLQCAQCHTHKFDPLTHEEYYKLFSFLNNDYENTAWIYPPEQLKVIETVKSDTARLEAELKTKNPDWESRLNKWEQKNRTNLVAWTPLDFHSYEWVGGLSHPEKLPDKSIFTLGYRANNGELIVITTNVPANIKGLRFDALTHGDLPFGGPGRSPKGTFAVAELVVEAATLGSNNWTKLILTNAVADFAEAQRPLEAIFTHANDNRVVGPANLLIDGKDETAWGTDRGAGRRNQNSSWAAEFVSTNAWPTGAVQMKITLKFRHAGDDGHGRQNNFLGRFQLSVTSDAKPVREILPVSVRKVLTTAPEKRTAAQKQTLFSFYRTKAARFKEANAEIDAAWKKFPEGESILNLALREPEWKRDTLILDRGNWQKPTKKVEAGVPSFLHEFPKNAPLNRLGFAQWLVDKKSPTTARVFVNRVWQSIFGMGLVDTPEDFGVRANAPSHPELLDWLAVEFMEPSFQVRNDAQAWSLKQLVRTIVTSSTYQQSSAVTPRLLELDPRNRWLSRGPRFRAEAEVVRDIALSAAGLLNEKVGGPSVYPPVPESVFQQSFVKIDWPTATGPERYRRSLYTFRRRSLPDPVLMSFDAPNGDFACVRRLRSNTPLAALATLNEPIFVEAAQALALRTLKEGGKTEEERAGYIFRLCTSRKAKSEEVREILSLFKSRQQKIADGWLSPTDIVLNTPEKMKQLPAGTTPNQATAWTIVARVLLNLDETISKN